MSRTFFCLILSTALMLIKISGSIAQTPYSWKLSSGDLDFKDQPEATATARQEQKKETYSWLRPERYNLQVNPLNQSTERIWREILWAIALEEAKYPEIEETLNKILAFTESHSQETILKRAFQSATEIYLADGNSSPILKDRFIEIINNSNNPKWVAIALEALVSKEPNSPDIPNWIDIIRRRFPHTDSILLQTTIEDVLFRLRPQSLPPLKDLLTWKLVPNQSQLYVLCRTDRSILCLAILKDRKGNFLYDQGKLWSVPLLTRSLHGLRSQFEHGQTPAGIFRIEGKMPRAEARYFRAYGQFPLIKLYLPFEDGVSSSGALPNNLSSYKSLLPPSWRGYFPIEESFWAGKIGRGLIRIHGSGEGQDFFASSARFPASYGWNPAIGCLSALELYDQFGRMQKADMPKILRAISQASQGIIEGYMILVEIPSENKQALTVEEIQSILRESAVEDNSQTIKVEPPPLSP